jgi:hypothetical protein
MALNDGAPDGLHSISGTSTALISLAASIAPDEAPKTKICTSGWILFQLRHAFRWFQSDSFLNGLGLQKIVSIYS